MRRDKIIGIFCMFTSLVALGQESSQYSIFMGQKYALNPAYAGMESSLSITGIYRAQWQELAGSPTSRMIHANMPLYYVKGAGGIKLEQESFGVEKTIRGLISYNYVFENNLGLFSAGLGLGFVQKSFDGSLLRTPSGKYEGGIIFHQDNILPETQANGLVPQVSAGIYFAQERLEAGLSVENFHNPTIHFNRITAEYKLRPRFNFYAEYKFDLNESLVITPFLLIKSDLVLTQTDLTGLATINQNVLAGIGLRGYSSNTLDAISVLGGLQVNPNLRVLYAFDFTLSSIKTVHQGTHELMLNYNLNKKIGGVEREPIIFNPRY